MAELTVIFVVINPGHSKHTTFQGFRYLYRGYYMAARGYEFYLRVQPRSFPGSLIFPPCLARPLAPVGGKMRDPGNEVASSAESISHE